MAKNLKLNIKNEQIAQAINLSGLKSKLAKKNDATSQAPETEKPSSPITAELLEKPKSKTASAKSSATSTKAHPQKTETASSDKLDSHEIKEEAPKIRARTRSAFAEPVAAEEKPLHLSEKSIEQIAPAIVETTSIFNIPSEDTGSDETQQRKTSEQLRKEIFGDELEIKETHQAPLLQSSHQKTKATDSLAAAQKENQFLKPPIKETPSFQPVKGSILKPSQPPVRVYTTPPMKLGPTGRHVNDLIPQRRPEPVVPEVKAAVAPSSTTKSVDSESNKSRMKPKPRETTPLVVADDDKKGLKPAKFKEFKDIKPVKKEENTRFDGRDKSGLRDTEETTHWKKRKAKGSRYVQEDVTIRPTTLAVKIPIAIKDLAAEMKLKASQLIAKLFSQGVAVTLNDILEDETTIQLLGQEFGCDISIDTKEEKRIRITDKTIRDEIKETDPSLLTIRSPVVAFMGHVDHGKTSLIDAIRKTNRAEGEAGAITQHIGAFKCSTSVGDIAILDTPGHEAFSAMRARGADVTDIVVLVIAGDEGMRLQTIEALNHAKTAKVTIVVAINKCDKQNFNAENVYRQLSEQELLPEVWGGQTITINCSAVTGEGIQQLLEMLALQSEILEIKANKSARARGTVLESEMHKGMGPIATVLVQNGTLKIGDALVFGQLWGRVKTMQDEFRRDLLEAGPSTPVEITGLSGLPEAGQEFIVVKNEKEARNIAENRMLGIRQVNLLQTKKLSMDNLILQAAETNKKILNIVLRADVQGSLEALKVALMKIHSTKATLNIIYAGVGEVSESDVQLAAASKAVVIGFHTQIESHADNIVKQHGVVVKLHNIIYHAVDDVKVLMGNLLDKIALETEKGKAEIRATFKSSQHGVIAGCIIIEGSIVRNNQVRLRREKEIIWKGSIASLKRVKEDVREVTKGIECGILLNGFYDTKEGDILEAYEITYITQEL